jgi:uncharacterized repeat protein (TIGR01451 family)
VPLLYDPELAIDKVVTGVFNADDTNDEDGIADAAGDYITYDVKVTNTGNVTLTGVDISDPLLGGVLDSDVTVDVGDDYTVSGQYTVTQADLDSKGTLEPNDSEEGKLDNKATADSNETDPVDDSEQVPLLYSPGVDIEKEVRINQDGNWTAWLDADTPTGPVADQDDVIEFRFNVANTGNVTLTGLEVTDNKFDLSAWVPGGDGALDVGETDSYVFTGATFQAGQHTNTATVTSNQDATDNDDANYKGVFDGPGVRTPGFWSNLGLQFWDGKSGFDKSGANFPNKELAPIGPSASTYLTLGGDHDNVLEAGELRISLQDAVSLINASQKLQQDGRWMLARDAIATELNLRSGNPGTDGDANTVDPEHLLDDAVKWLDLTTNNDHTLTTAELSTGKVATSDTKWQNPYLSVDHAASTLHSQLDSYNNNGTVFGAQFANDGDLIV